MNEKICPVCNNVAYFRLEKEGVEYHQCTNCRTLFSDPLDNDNKVGGGSEIERNTLQNGIRIQRIRNMFYDKKVSDLNVLDFGCGNGLLLNDLKNEGFQFEGYDAYNPKFATLPEKNKFDIVTMIEVIEHTSKPYVELDVIYRSLKSKGVVMIETSFVDVAVEENIELEDFFYIAPSVGHSSIFSHHGLDLLMALKGFIPFQHIDRHVRIFTKK